MEMSVTEKNDFSIIKLKGEFDLHDVDDFEASLRELLKKFKKFVIDFSNLEYIDSSGIGQFIRLQTDLANDDGVLYIFGLNDFISRIISMANLDTFFNIKSKAEIDDILKS